MDDAGRWVKIARVKPNTIITIYCARIPRKKVVKIPQPFSPKLQMSPNLDYFQRE